MIVYTEYCCPICSSKLLLKVNTPFNEYSKAKEYAAVQNDMSDDLWLFEQKHKYPFNCFKLISKKQNE